MNTNTGVAPDKIDSNGGKGRKVSIAPGAIDSNKGDQALVAAAINMCKRLYVDADIGLIGDARRDGDIDELRQTRAMGVRELQPILMSPRRGPCRRSGEHDGLVTTIKMAVISIRDAIWSLPFLLFCEHE